MPNSYLIDVEHGDEAMRVHVPINTVVDGDHMQHLRMSTAGFSVSAEVADGPQFDERGVDVVVQRPASVWMDRRGDVDADEGDTKKTNQLHPLDEPRATHASVHRLDTDRQLVVLSASPYRLDRHEHRSGGRISLGPVYDAQFCLQCKSSQCSL